MTVNPQRGEVEVELEGRRYALRPTFEALAEIEAATGTGVMELAGRLAERRFAFAEVTAIVAAGLKAAGRPVARKRIAEMVFNTGLLAVARPAGEFLWTALGAGQADQEDAAEDADAEDAPGEAPAAEG